jgi:DNA-binding NtrC family response regulator
MSEKISVLLIDDEPIVGKRLKPALSKMGCEIEAFQDSLSAVKRLDEKEFDIVVTDVRLEDMDGIEILDLVRKKSEKTEVIIMTGFAMMELARKAVEKGAFDFIEKPFKAHELQAVISRAVETLGKKLPSL